MYVIRSPHSRTLREKYGYDGKGQLVRHYSARQDRTFVYEYDDAGNITALNGQSFTLTGRQLAANY